MISGKSFADYCRWVWDPRYPERDIFSYASASDGDWVFVNGDYLSQLCSRFPLIISKRFVFVVHNTDRSFGEPELAMLLPRARHIYAINTTTFHPRLTTIPLGFVDKQLSMLESFKGGSSERPHEVYMNFLVRTNPVKRLECRAALRDDPRVTRAEDRSVPEYFADLGKSKFVVCPVGTGIDTHRVYESLLCGATPVVLRSSLDHLYKKLPVCIVDKWTDTYVVPEQKPIGWSIKEFL